MHPTCLSNIGEARVTVAEGMEERVVGAKGSEVMGRLSVCVYMCFHECVCVSECLCVSACLCVYSCVCVCI